MNQIEHLAEAYVEARRLHSGQRAAWVRLRDGVNAAMAARFPKLPHVAPAVSDAPAHKTFSQRLRAAFRNICGEVA